MVARGRLQQGCQLELGRGPAAERETHGGPAGRPRLRHRERGRRMGGAPESLVGFGVWTTWLQDNRDAGHEFVGKLEPEDGRLGCRQRTCPPTVVPREHHPIGGRARRARRGRCERHAADASRRMPRCEAVLSGPPQCGGPAAGGGEGTRAAGRQPHPGEVRVPEVRRPQWARRHCGADATHEVDDQVQRSIGRCRPVYPDDSAVG